MNQDRDAIHWRGCSSEVRYCPSLTNAAGLRRYGLDLETSPLDWINTPAFQRLFLLASLPLGGALVLRLPRTAQALLLCSA